MDVRKPPSDRPLHAGAQDTVPLPARRKRLARGSGSGIAPNRVLPKGTRIGRYMIDGLLGRGGMGVVYAARDVDLHRKVAIKFIASRVTGADVRMNKRLVREAQAAAALSHPNVVSIYAVDTHEGQPYIAMEYVEGSTLRGWLTERSRTWREVVKVFVAAGRGLAAAHDAGLVHRDFKPDNVLIGPDRVRVADFGLARSVVEDTPSDEAVLAGRDVLPTVTRVDTVVGTPRYMAPEQRANKRIDARADQYSFCLALNEALAEEEGDPRSPLRSQAPDWVRRVVVRGLKEDPDERYCDMRALLRDLGRDPRARRRRLLSLAVVPLLAGGAATAVWLAMPDPPALCQNAHAQLAGVWDDERRTAIRDAFVATGQPHAGATYVRVAAKIDAYASDWTAMHTEACEATHVDGDQSNELLDVRMQCLDRHLGSLRSLTEVFSEATPSTVDRAIGAVYKLAPLSVCADRGLLAEAVPLPSDPELRDTITTLRKRLDRAAALGRAGRFAEALSAAEGTIEHARGVDYWPVRSEALLTFGRLQANAGEPNAAEQTLRQAVQAAARAKDDIAVVEAWSLLAQVIGRRQERVGDALALRSSLSAAVARAGDQPLSKAVYEHTLAALLHRTGQYGEAQKRFEAALTIFARELGADSPQAIRSLEALAAATARLGTLALADERYRDVVSRAERAFGQEHPHLAAFLDNYGVLLTDMGKHAEALALHQRALAIFGGVDAAPKRNVAVSLQNISTAYHGLGQTDRAREYAMRALAAKEKVLGPDHPSVATTLSNLGAFEEAAGRDEQARKYHRRALEIRQRVLGAEHPQVAISLFNLALVTKDREERRRLFERSLALEEKALGPNHPNLAYALTSLGQLELVRRPRRAIGFLERAYGLRKPKAINPRDRAETMFLLAQALWSVKGDRGRARRLARNAEAALAGIGEAARAQRSKIRSWLAKRGIRVGD